jgi:hypothetical protein
MLLGFGIKQADDDKERLTVGEALKSLRVPLGSFQFAWRWLRDHGFGAIGWEPESILLRPHRENDDEIDYEVKLPRDNLIDRVIFAMNNRSVFKEYDIDDGKLDISILSLAKPVYSNFAIWLDSLPGNYDSDKEYILTLRNVIFSKRDIIRWSGEKDGDEFGTYRSANDHDLVVRERQGPGRPKLYDLNEVMIALVAYAAKNEIKRQSDIESFFLEFFGRQDRYPSTATVRGWAKPIWDKMQDR